MSRGLKSRTLLSQWLSKKSCSGRVLVVNKKHREFFVIDMNSGWETLAGYPERIQQKILSGALDEANKRAVARDCCASLLGRSPPNMWCTNIGRKFTLSQGISLLGGNFFRPTVIHANLPAFIMVHSNRMAVVCFLRFIISIQSGFG